MLYRLLLAFLLLLVWGGFSALVTFFSNQTGFPMTAMDVLAVTLSVAMLYGLYRMVSSRKQNRHKVKWPGYRSFAGFVCFALILTSCSLALAFYSATTLFEYSNFEHALTLAHHGYSVFAVAFTFSAFGVASLFFLATVFRSRKPRV